MHSLREDIEELNQKVLLLAVDPDDAELCVRYLGASQTVVERLRRATAGGCRCAISCGVPLVTLQSQVASDLAAPSGVEVSSRKFREKIPEAMVEINLLSLNLARRIALINPQIACLLFGLNRGEMEVVVAACMRDIRVYAGRSAAVVMLRGASAPVLWERMMIGGRIDGPRGRRLSHDAALQSLQAMAGG